MTLLPASGCNDSGAGFVFFFLVNAKTGNNKLAAVFISTDKRIEKPRPRLAVPQAPERSKICALRPSALARASARCKFFLHAPAIMSAYFRWRYAVLFSSVGEIGAATGNAILVKSRTAARKTPLLSLALALTAHAPPSCNLPLSSRSRKFPPARSEHL